MSLRERYPASSFLLQKERRFLVKRTDGSFDPIALRNAHTQLAFAPVDADVRVRLQKSVARLLCVGDAVKKDAWAYGDIEAAGKLHTGFGFPIVIEVLDGGTRSGTSKDGTKWETKLDGMSYGFLPDTIAADAEELDAIVGKDITAPMAFVIDQGDECKLALGYANAQDARGAYEKNWPAGMLKEMFEVPMEVVRALLGASPSSLSNSVYAAKRMSGMSGGTVIVSNGEVIGEIRKSALPAPRPADLVQEPLNVAMKARAERVRKSLDGARSYQGEVTSIDDHPGLAGHPARSAPLSFRYDDPTEMGGWLGEIEAPDGLWIAFVDTTGHVLMWTARGPNGDIIGAPVSFMRPELAVSAQTKTENERSTAHKSRVLRAFKFLDPLSQKATTAITPIEKSTDDKPMLVWGVILESEPNNGAGDLHRETYGDEFVINTAYDFNAWYLNLDDQHGEFIPPNKAVIIESYVTKQAEQWGERTVKAITWIMGIRIYDSELKRQILAGEKTGLSIEGFAERVPNTAAA
jgi:hypothetical protein